MTAVGVMLAWAAHLPVVLEHSQAPGSASGTGGNAEPQARSQGGARNLHFETLALTNEVGAYFRNTVLGSSLRRQPNGEKTHIHQPRGS